MHVAHAPNVSRLHTRARRGTLYRTVPRTTSPEKLADIRDRLAKKEPIAKIAREVGVHRDTVYRARVPERVRKADEFKTPPPRRAPRRTGSAHCWDLEKIVAARTCQMNGDFGPAVRLARAMRADDAAFIAFHNRIAPQNSIAATLIPAPGARGEAVAKKAAKSIICEKAVLAGIVGTLADHGIAIGHIDRETNDEGTRTNIRLREWPLEFVKWNSSREVLETQVHDGPRADIVHGDGEWIVFRKFDLDPWTQEACVIPGALVWASHSGALKDWNATARSHGLAKMIAILKEGLALADADGVLSPNAESVLATLQDLAEGEAGAGVFPNDTTVSVLHNGSNAWQVFSELVPSREKAFARIYLGTDAVLGSVGGAPGLDIEALFKVAAGKIQGDFLALKEGLRTGLYEPWTAINEGDSTRAPSIEFELPDKDAELRSADAEAKLARLHAEIERRKKNGMTITQETVAALAKTFGVRDVPVLDGKPSVQIPPETVTQIISVDEARELEGFTPIGGEVGAAFVPQLDQALKTKAKKEEIAAQAAADAEAARIAAENAPPPPLVTPNATDTAGA